MSGGDDRHRTADEREVAHEGVIGDPPDSFASRGNDTDVVVEHEADIAAPNEDVLERSGPEGTGPGDESKDAPESSDVETEGAAPGQFFSEITIPETRPLYFETVRDWDREYWETRQRYRRTRTRARLTLLWFVLFGIVTLGISSYIANLQFDAQPTHEFYGILAIGVGLGLALGDFAVYVFLALPRMNSRRYPEGEAASQGSSKGPARQGQADESRSRNEVLMLQYHEITKRQSKSSYRNSQIAMSVGLAVLVAGSVAAVVSKAVSTQILVGSLTGLGTALSGYLSRTFIREYNRAQSQMNYFFGQPLVTSYLLEAERMANTLESDRRDTAIESVVAATLRGASSAASALVFDGNAGRPMSGRGRSSIDEALVPEQDAPKDSRW
jgi:hypothetical protein